ncbi:MAG: hypothetical protein KatS3mg007_2340 [Thermoanaerobaculum sp.]|nr:MAG: hypothetical protein KatS3mg007_2340 [Thermoanaerobaculum sp.]
MVRLGAFRWALILGFAAGPGEVLAADLPFHERADVLAVSVWVRGEQLLPEHLVVRVDGAPVQVVSLLPHGSLMRLSSANGQREELGEPRPPETGVRGDQVEVAVVLPTSMCSRFCRAAAARTLEAEAPHLVALGPVRVVLARASGPQELAAGVRDAETLRLLARNVIPKVLSRNELVSEERWLGAETRRLVGETAYFLATPVPGAVFPVESAARVRMLLAHIKMAVASGKQAPSTVLILLSDGFEVVPSLYWHELLAQVGEDRRYSWETPLFARWRGAGEAEIVQPTRAFAQELAAEGVLAVPYFFGVAGTFAPTWGAEVSGRWTAREFMTAGYTVGTHWVDDGVIHEPHEGLRLLAEETGGFMVPAGGELSAVEGPGELYLLTYQVAGVPDGNLHTLEVASRDGRVLWAPQHVRHGGAGMGQEGAVRRLLRWDQKAGTLPVAVAVKNLKRTTDRELQGTLRVDADFQEAFPLLARLGKAHVKVLLAVDVGDVEPFVYRRDVVEEVKPKEGSRWSFEAPIRLPAKARKLAVVVEEVSTGTTGGAVTTLGQR